MVCFGPLDLQTSAIGRRLAEFQTPLESCTRAASNLFSSTTIHHHIPYVHNPPEGFGEW